VLGRYLVASCFQKPASHPRDLAGQASGRLGCAVSPGSFLHTACIGLGSNLGRSRSLLQDAWHALSVHPACSAQIISSAYSTKPVAMESNHWFINAVGLLKTRLSPHDLFEVLRQLELDFGRILPAGKSGYQDRTLDLDLLLFDDLVINTAELTLPHPLLHKRCFVLVPLAEVAPQLWHPLLKKTIAQIMTDLPPAMEANDVFRVEWCGVAGDSVDFDP